MPNTFAYLMIIIWPVVSLTLFQRLKPLQASFWTIVGGYIILPEQTFFDFPLLPSFDKETVAMLAALAGCYFVANQKVPLLPRQGTEKWLIVVMLVTPLLTAVTNPEPFRFISGMTLYDACSVIMSSYIAIIPFLIGLHLVRTYQDQVSLFKMLVIAGLLYSLPALFEARMSPQLHSTIYGFFPHEWRQQIRFGGFRPVVFMRHGLVTSAFFSITLMACIALWRDKQGIFGVSRDTKKFTFFAVLYLAVILVLCKSVGSILYSVTFLMAVCFLPLSLTRLVASFLMAIVITYPLSSLVGIFPHEQLVGLATNINELRAQSLEFRFMNEDFLLSHAKEKLLFGWGIWGRNRPFKEVVTDGYWIVLLGSVGLISFLARFGLSALCVFRAARASKRLKQNTGNKLMVFHALLVALIMVDQIPNSSMSSYQLFLIGALLGRANQVLFQRSSGSNARPREIPDATSQTAPRSPR